MKETSFTLGPFHLDRQYPSMTGPDKREKVTLGAGEAGAQIWVKAMRLDIRNGQGEAEPVDYLCHAWLAMDRPGDQSVPQKTKGTVTTRGRNFYLEDSMNFTLSGSHREIRLPPGYAIPVERCDLNATVVAVALNNEDGALEKDLYMPCFQDSSDHADGAKSEINERFDPGFRQQPLRSRYRR